MLFHVETSKNIKQKIDSFASDSNYNASPCRFLFLNNKLSLYPPIQYRYTLLSESNKIVKSIVNLTHFISETVAFLSQI